MNLFAGECNVDKYVHRDNKIQSIYSVLYLITVVDVYTFFEYSNILKIKKRIHSRPSLNFAIELN